MKPKLMPGYLPYGTTHKPTIRAKKKIIELKKELFEIYADYCMSLDDSDRRILDLLMEDSEVNYE